MMEMLDFVHGLLWGAPLLTAILGSGLWLTVCTHCVQLRLFSRAMGLFFGRFFPGGKREAQSGSAFRALCTALAATVGTGNLIGVAGAICLGGPGAVFWMILCAFFGMAIKYAEAALAVRYQRREGAELVGGPMHMIRLGMPGRWLPLAYCYSAFGILASLGVGNMTQVNAIVSSVRSIWTPLPPAAIGIVLTVLVGFAFLGGADSIGRIAEIIVPFAAGAYILLCLVLLAFRYEAVPAAFCAIFQGAFSPRAVTGGAIGSAFRAMQYGCSRGIFTNEAGMGTASIAHASADVQHPAEQGMLGIVEVFLDTVVICLLTALVILCSGIPISYGTDSGATLAISAFSSLYGRWGKGIIALFLSFFAYATILGWSLYGLRCFQFFFRTKADSPFFLLQISVVMFGAVLAPPVVWRLAEVMNGLMALPNLVVLLYLSPELIELTNSYTSGASAHRRR